MKTLVYALILVVVAIACLMEALKALIEAICNKVKKRKVDVPPFVWWIMGAVFSAAFTVLTLHLVRLDVQDMAPLMLIATDPWAPFLWTPIIWWLQMQLDMKLVKGWALPLLKRLVERKVDKL